MTSWPKIKNRFGIILLFASDIITLAVIFYISVFTRINILPKLSSSLPAFNQNLETYWWIFLVLAAGNNL